MFVRTGEVIALPDVCTMANIDSSKLPASTDVVGYRAKLTAECELSEKYLQMKNKAQIRYGISLEQISQFQALRYVRRSSYTAAKYNNTPVNIIYQIFDEQYARPELRDTKVWDGFLKGVETLPADRARLQAGGQLEFSDLMRIHRNFYQVSDENGDAANNPMPGRIKPPSSNDGHWWRLKPEDVESMTKVVNGINETYLQLGLILSGVQTMYDAPYLSELISVRPLKDGTGYGFYGGDSRGNEQHLENIIAVVNAMLAQARETGVMVRNGRLITPGELAFLTQQFLVQTHPFYDGNGRTTRYVQELILTSFGLPYGASGDLMDDDVTTPLGDYYQTALAATRALLTSVDECLEVTYPAAMTITTNVKSEGRKGESQTKTETRPFSSIDQAALAYECRLLN